jgi:hypothetical protein
MGKVATGKADDNLEIEKSGIANDPDYGKNRRIDFPRSFKIHPR